MRHIEARPYNRGQAEGFEGLLGVEHGIVVLQGKRRDAAYLYLEVYVLQHQVLKGEIRLGDGLPAFVFDVFEQQL